MFLFLKLPFTDSTLTPALSPAFAEAASRRQASSERGKGVIVTPWALTYKFT